MKKIVSIALAIALICFMIASTAFANETAVLKVETTTTSVQQGENVVIKISMSSNTTKNIAAIGFNVEVPDSFEYVSHTLASGLPENAVYTNRTGTFGCYNGQLSGDFEIVTITYKVKEAADAGDVSVGIKNDDDLSVTDVDDGLVDLTINPCTLTITTPHVHQWATEWTSDGTHHWHECTAEGCTLTAGTANSEKGGYAEHNWTAANCTTAKTCSICGKTEGSALGHDHNGPWVTTDENEHWKVCAREGCNEQLDKAVHNPSAWVNVGDGYHHQTCTVCERELTHEVCTFGQPLKYNATSHWEECTKCGNKQNEAAHEFLPDSDKCTGCDYTKSSTITIIIPTQPGDSKPAEGNPSTGAVSSPVGYVFVSLAVVGALCLGAKKLTKKHED